MPMEILHILLKGDDEEVEEEKQEATQVQDAS